MTTLIPTIIITFTATLIVHIYPIMFATNDNNLKDHFSWLKDKAIFSKLSFFFLTEEEKSKIIRKKITKNAYIKLVFSHQGVRIKKFLDNIEASNVPLIK